MMTAFRHRLLCMLCVGMGIVGHVSAGEFNEVLNIGDAAPGWSALPGTDGQPHSLTELKEKPIVVVAFSCLSCPTARDYEDRLNALAQKYAGPAGKVAVVAICVNKVKEDQLDKLTARVADRKLQFPFLYDETQKVAREFGALFTPEFYVLNAERKIVYMGAFDDQTDPAKATVNYVEAAIEATLAGKSPTVKETIARGCRVRYTRDRKAE